MILYIGNNLKSKSVTITGVSTMSLLLEQEGLLVKVVSSIKNRMLRLLSMMFSILKYAFRIDFVLIDTYSTQNFIYAFLCSQLCRTLNIRYVPILRGGNLPNRLNTSPKLCRMIFKHSYVNVAPSNYLKEAFENSGYRTKYIPNVLEIDKYPFKERLQLSPQLLFVRSFSSIYNPQLAIEVLNALLPKYPEAKLCMVGPKKDSSLDECKKLVIQYGIADKVEFTGKLTKEQWHKKSEEFDIFINPTNFDNTPVSVMEAMALGLPVVSTNVGGLPYLISNRKEGLLVNKESVTEMTQAIEMLLTDSKLAQEITENARSKVMEFDWNNVKHHWLELLHKN